ncbi:POTRA domain-containing protein, partial [Enterococcus faecium]
VDIRSIPAQPDGFDVEVTVKEWPVIREIRLVGNTVIKNDPILAAIPLKVGQVFNARLSKPTADAISALYTKSGYFARVQQLGPLSSS